MSHRMFAIITIIALVVLCSDIVLAPVIGSKNQSVVTIGTPQQVITVGAAPQASATSGVQIGSGAQIGRTQSTFPMAVYSAQAPLANEQMIMLPFNPSLTGSVYSNGNYVPLSSLTPGISPIFWIETSLGWSWYASIPQGSWARELMYIPSSGPVQVYEIYPSGMTQLLNLGQAQSGYSYIWFNANTPGRYTSIFTVNGVPSNAVTVDVQPASGYVQNQAYPINASPVAYIPASSGYSTPGMPVYSIVTGPQGTTVSSSSSSGTSSSTVSY